MTLSFTPCFAEGRSLLVPVPRCRGTPASLMSLLLAEIFHLFFPSPAYFLEGFFSFPFLSALIFPPVSVSLFPQVFFAMPDLKLPPTFTGLCVAFFAARDWWDQHSMCPGPFHTHKSAPAFGAEDCLGSFSVVCGKVVSHFLPPPSPPIFFEFHPRRSQVLFPLSLGVGSSGVCEESLHVRRIFRVISVPPFLWL